MSGPMFNNEQYNAVKKTEFQSALVFDKLNSHEKMRDTKVTNFYVNQLLVVQNITFRKSKRTLTNHFCYFPLSFRKILTYFVSTW